MKKLQMPSSYAELSLDEQRSACGGGEFGDAINEFFNSLHIDDFFYGGGLLSFSITFVPMLLFQAVKLGIQTGISIYEQIKQLLGLAETTSATAAEYVTIEKQKLTLHTDATYTPSTPVK